MFEKSSAMRDSLLKEIYNELNTNDKIILLSADFGAPILDRIRKDFPDNFINVGIAEQNLVNIAAGFALEGYKVYAYAISAFLTMRAYEQIRTNISLMSQLKTMNVNLVGVGTGISYVLSGPTHHCLEDITSMRLLPHLKIFSPSDSILTQKFFKYSLNENSPKYIRFDSKILPDIYKPEDDIKIENGFCELIKGNGVCILSTGYMTQKAVEVVNDLKKENIDTGVIDMFLLSGFNEGLLSETIKKYKCIISLEESFVNRGGLDSIASNIIDDNKFEIKLIRLGFKDRFVFENGDREYLHSLQGLDIESLKKIIKSNI
ncbi:transketolase [Candidatus Dependentiae bacterium]|nr:transketolase [Candidatus Dependentiae bacterium]